MTSIHLLVIIPGLWGIPDHVAELERTIHENYATGGPGGVELRVHVAKSNCEESTVDGVDWGGERVTREVLHKVAALEESGNSKITKFSITGYSLGGLIARYVIGILHQRQFFENIVPVNFNTIATPHIGLPRYSTLISSLVASLGPKLLSRTGEQLFCVDQWSPSGRSLIEVMADPDRVFYQGLSKFQYLRIYANAINDTVVPYVTSAIDVVDPFAARWTNGIEIEISEEYSPLIKNYTLPPVPPTPPNKTALSPGWFRNRAPTIPFLPPTLHVRFPLNIGVYTLLPILAPLGISVTLVYLVFAARSSRARIRLLESDEAGEQTLIRILADLERNVETTVADLVDGADPGPTLRPSNKSKVSPEQPILTPLQQNVAMSLNKLPFKKERAYIENVQNSHAVILCRDLKRFDAHKMGAGILRHWAASFVL
ncbi:DUF676-domain-containing protein [Collybia nuda]|uniref:DUF676-domain-containing protein n=1 Tax=Collybia nuda TaxID=64659 RepID=A0A9P6CH25_9AGAR|nr:DUF676-domain-containing protein [Collybia nuda]